MAAIRAFAAVFLGAILCSCVLQSESIEDELPVDCIGDANVLPYFPEEKSTEFYEAFFAAHLRALEEPGLSETSVETIRLTILAYDRPPLSLRLERSTDEYSDFVGKFIDVNGHYCPENYPVWMRRYPTVVVETGFDNSIWSEIRLDSERAMQSIKRVRTSEWDICVHGTAWLIEYMRPEGYEYEFHDGCDLPPGDLPIDRLCRTLIAEMPILPIASGRYCRDAP